MVYLPVFNLFGGQDCVIKHHCPVLGVKRVHEADLHDTVTLADCLDLVAESFTQDFFSNALHTFDFEAVSMNLVCSLEFKCVFLIRLNCIAKIIKFCLYLLTLDK